MSEAPWDVVVVGAGIHGAGVAQAAAAAGYRTLLLEKDEPAHGTSSRSSKLIHGGLRYLEHARFGMVRESLRERALLLRNAPELVHLVVFYLPVYRATRRRPWQIRAGLSLYALLGGLGREARFRSLPRGEWEGLDGLELDGLQAVFRYSDAQTDDAALTRAVIRSAIELGARLEVRSPLVRAERRERLRDGSAGGFSLTYGSEETSEGIREVEARALVNAAGPWAEEVADRVVPSPPRLPVELVQGTHIVLAGRLERGIYYVEAPQDGRAVFAMPWSPEPLAGASEPVTGILVGTTETVYEGDPDGVRPLPEEIEYLREAFRHYFPGRPAEVRAAFAGLRVLPREETAAFGRSRELRLVPDDPREPRWVTLYGGKLTTYRAAADKVVRFLAPALPTRRRLADTRELRLVPDEASP